MRKLIVWNLESTDTYDVWIKMDEAENWLARYSELRRQSEYFLF
jgi:hypothetical protein